MMIIKCANHLPCIAVSDAPYKFKNNNCASYMYNNNIIARNKSRHVYIYGTILTLRHGILKVMHIVSYLINVRYAFLQSCMSATGSYSIGHLYLIILLFHSIRLHGCGPIAKTVL